MATERKTLPSTWHADGRITAAGETNILAENTSDRDGAPRSFYWAITADDALPAFGAHLGHEVRPGERLSMKLADAERLNLMARGAITITLTTGGA